MGLDAGVEPNAKEGAGVVEGTGAFAGVVGAVEAEAEPKVKGLTEEVEA